MSFRLAGLCLFALGLFPALQGADQPQWGERYSRNMISAERGLPARFDPQTGENILWTAALGTESHSTPVVANGRVYMGTNNGTPRDPKHQGDRGVLMCFSEKDGRLLWQLVVPKREEDPYHDWPNSGFCSPVTVEGDRVYVVTSRGEVVCLDAKGLENGNDGPYVDEGRHLAPKGAPALEPGPLDADILWLFDLTSEAGIWSHDGAHSSILLHGDLLYLNTGTGVDNTHRRIRTPEAPSLVVLHKSDGRYIARDQEKIAPNIFHCTWASPSLGRVDGREQIFFAAGNGFLYAFEPVGQLPPSGQVLKLHKLWEFDFDPAAPKEQVHRFTTNRREGPSNFYAMPVFQEGRIYLSGGGDIFWGKNEAWLKCIDASPREKITGSRELWAYPLEKHALSTAAVFQNLIFVADCGRVMHCVNARNGERLWTQDIRGEVWSSPLVADGKVYLGTRAGEFWIFEAGAEKKVLQQLNLGTPISATVTAANGAIYVATMTRLYCVKEGARAEKGP